MSFERAVIYTGLVLFSIGHRYFNNDDLGFGLAILILPLCVVAMIGAKHEALTKQKKDDK